MEIMMSSIIILVALLHFYFLVLEMFLWDKPLGLKTFGHSIEKAALTKVLAANQGLYNGFLAAGLIWSLLLAREQAYTIQIFFLTCIVIAGIYGGFTASKKIFYVQSVYYWF